MSLFRKVTDRFTSPKARISLQLSKKTFVLGETVEATLAVSSDEEFDAKEIRAEIQCVELARRVVGFVRTVPRESEQSRVLYFAKLRTAGPTLITQGYSHVFPVSINIPANGMPTYFQDIELRVQWYVKGVIAINGRPDVTSSPTEIQIT